VNRTAVSEFLRDVVVVLGILAASALYVTRFVAIPWVVLGPSMRPTLEPGDRVLVDLWTYRQRPPRSGEVVLASGPGDAPLVKRIASGPDETGSYVVLGDNAAASADSRQFGVLPRRSFQGRLVFRYWPPTRAGSIR